MTDTANSEGSFSLAPWDAEGATQLTATGSTAEAVIVAGLQGVIAAAHDDAVPTTGMETATSAAPIRGQGTDLNGVFAELAADLLAQLDANGPGLTGIRLDGLLATDDGAYTAWGYAVGEATDHPAPVGLAIDSEPTIEETGEGLTLRCALRRG